MKYCLKCGASNADSSKFCVECGAALNTPEPENTDFTYNEVDDNNTVDQNDTFDTTYTYGDPAKESVNTTDVITYNTEDNSEKTEDKYTYTYNTESNTHTTYNSVHPGIGQRNIVLAIILSFVTCGIYQIYWMIKINDEVNLLASEPDAPSGVIVFLLSLVTCGIYGLFWMYKMGERCDRIKGSVGGSSAILYLILGVLGLGIVNYCLIQDTLNKAV